MVTILIDQNNYDESLEKDLKHYSKVKIVKTKFIGLDESQPVVFRVQDSTFYENVTIDRLIDVIAGHADDLKIQTSKTFDVESNKYVIELKYRQIVSKFLSQLTKLQDYNSDAIAKEIKTFCKENKFIEKEVNESLKMSLIKTIKGPLLVDLLVGYGKDESIRLIKKHLDFYKGRY